MLWGVSSGPTYLGAPTIIPVYSTGKAWERMLAGVRVVNWCPGTVIVFIHWNLVEPQFER